MNAYILFTKIYNEVDKATGQAIELIPHLVSRLVEINPTILTFVNNPQNLTSCSNQG
jgi:hypothetical protein